MIATLCVANTHIRTVAQCPMYDRSVIKSFQFIHKTLAWFGLVRLLSVVCATIFVATNIARSMRYSRSAVDPILSAIEKRCKTKAFDNGCAVWSHFNFFDRLCASSSISFCFNERQRDGWFESDKRRQIVCDVNDGSCARSHQRKISIPLRTPVSHKDTRQRWRQKQKQQNRQQQ